MLVVNSCKNTQRRTKQVLVIMVNTIKHLDHVINLTSAARTKGKHVNLFFTGKGVLLTMTPQFKQLADMASVSICNASLRANGLHGRQEEIPGVSPVNFTSQAKYAEMLSQADRYLVF